MVLPHLRDGVMISKKVYYVAISMMTSQILQIKNPLITHQGLLLYFCSGGNLQKTFQLGLQKLSLLLLFK